MPVVPILSQPSTPLAPLGGEHVPRRIAATEETFGASGGLGGAGVPDSHELANVVQGIYQEQKRKSDQVAVLGAAAKVSTLETALATHARSQTGTNAYALPEAVKSAWDDQVSGIDTGLANDDQKLAFRNVVQSHWNSLNAIVQTHVATQHKVVAEQAVEGYTAAEAKAAVDNAPDPSPAAQMRVSEAVANTRAALTQHGDSVGQDPAYTKAHADEAVSKIHAAVLTRMLGTVQDGEQPTMAASYYAAHKNELTGPEASRFDNLVAKKSVEGTAQQQGDAIFRQSTTLSDAMTHAAQIQDPNVRTKTEERLRRSFEDKATSERQEREQTIISLNDMLHKNKGDFDALPIEQRDKLTPTEEESLRHNADQIRHPKQVTNQAVAASLATFRGLYPDKFMAMDLTPYRGDFSDKDYNALLSQQATMRLGELKGEGAAAKKAEAEKKKEAAARALLEGAGIHLAPSVPGAPIQKPAAPGQPMTNADPKIHALPIPQSWKDHAAADSAYAAYLKHHAPDDEEQD